LIAIGRRPHAQGPDRLAPNTWLIILLLAAVFQVAKPGGCSQGNPGRYARARVAIVRSECLHL